MATITKRMDFGGGAATGKRKLDWSKILLWTMLVSFPVTLIFILLAPSDYELKYSQRIFYFHMPANVLCLLSFTIYFIGGLGYWRTRKRSWDILMITGLELGVFFSLIGIVTGSIWAKYAWGTFWTWDPRLTTVTIMLVVYLAGWMLRSSVEDPNRKAALTAVFGIVGFINVPLVYFSTRFFPAGLHPIVFGTNGAAVALEGFMILTLVISIITFSQFFVYLMIQRIRLENLRDQVAGVRMALYEDEDFA